jgi:serine/threonine protein kinase
MEPHWTLRKALAGGPSEIEWTVTTSVRLCNALIEFQDKYRLHGALHPEAFLGSVDGRLSIAPPLDTELPAAALPYVAPERTGRMNRSVDARADLYALGAILYEIVAGRPPFSSDDALGLVHQHLARTPSPPTDDARIAPLSAVALKLLSKDPRAAAVDRGSPRRTSR